VATGITGRMDHGTSERHNILQVDFMHSWENGESIDQNAATRAMTVGLAFWAGVPGGGEDSCRGDRQSWILRGME
jgi:hypothetical protein